MKFNLVLTIVSLAIMAAIIGIGLSVIASGHGDISRLVVFETPNDRSIFAAVTMGTAIAFFAMVGFEDFGEPGGKNPEDPEKLSRDHVLIGLGICARRSTCWWQSP